MPHDERRDRLEPDHPADRDHRVPGERPDLAAPAAGAERPPHEPLYPVLLKLAGLPVVVVGGGPVAAARPPRSTVGFAQRSTRCGPTTSSAGSSLRAPPAQAGSAPARRSRSAARCCSARSVASTAAIKPPSPPSR